MVSWGIEVMFKANTTIRYMMHNTLLYIIKLLLEFKNILCVYPVVYVQTKIKLCPLLTWIVSIHIFIILSQRTNYRISNVKVQTILCE